MQPVQPVQPVQSIMPIPSSFPLVDEILQSHAQVGTDSLRTTGRVHPGSAGGLGLWRSSVLACRRQNIVQWLPVACTMPAKILPAITPERCTGCGRCVAACASHVLSLHIHKWVKTARLDDASACTACAQCLVVCPFGAVRMVRVGGKSISYEIRA